MSLRKGGKVPKAKIGKRQPPHVSFRRSRMRRITLNFSSVSLKTAARAGKMAYVRKDFHDRIMRITRVIGKGKTFSLSGYIDHVLAQHFLQCGDVIKKLYNENYEDVF
jgi:hypothetical protein